MIISPILKMLIANFGASFVNAFIIQFATTRIASFKPTYIHACLASILTLIAAYIIGFAGAIANLGSTSFGKPLTLLITFALGAALYGWILRHPTYGSIGIRKGALVSLAQLLLTGALLGGMMLFFYIYKQL